MPDDVPSAERLEQTHSRLSGPINAERMIKIICVGAGASGLLLAYKLQRSFDDNFELTIYEKNPEISGTWFENVYPGCACDIPAHMYTYSFEPNPKYKHVYAGNAEIYEYFNEFADKYGLRKYIKVNHEIIGTRWDDAEGHWLVDIKNTVTGEIIHDTGHFFINASGVLNAWKWPNIPGLHDFKGELLHTARWDKNIDLTGKHVGLIGNGSSGIQVLPAVQPIVKQIDVFIRSPTWVTPALGLEQRPYTKEEMREFSTNPNSLLEYRKAIEQQTNGIFNMFVMGTEIQKKGLVDLSKAMKNILNNDDLSSKLVPTWPVGCRRITPGVGYLESFGKENVKVVYGEIKCITENGILSENGTEYPFDVLISASGFDTSYRPRFPTIGVNGTDLRDDWAEEAKNYFGMTAPGFPNYFIFLGPNSPIGNGPVVAAMEGQADYMLKMISRWQVENIHSYDPKMEAVEDFTAYKDKLMEKTIWVKECKSWYKNNTISGKVTALWPGSTLHFLEAIRHVRWDDYNIRYQGNRFAWLGNGYSQTELDETADWAFYVRNEDDSPSLSRTQERKVWSKSGTMIGKKNAGTGAWIDF